MPRERWPKNWYAVEIAIFLGTADREAAKARCSEVRNGPKALSTEPIAALSGIAYRRSLSGWRTIRASRLSSGWMSQLPMMAQDGKFGFDAVLGISPDQSARRDGSMEQRCVGMVGATLVRQRVVTNDDSRWKLIEILARDMLELP